MLFVDVMHRVLMDMTGAAELEAEYLRAETKIDELVDTTAHLIREADALLATSGGAGWSAIYAPATLLHVSGDLRSDAHDIAWRREFLIASDARPITGGRLSGLVPPRNADMKRLPLADLVRMIGDGHSSDMAERQLALAELAIRSVGNPELADRMLTDIGEQTIWQIVEAAHAQTYSNGADWVDADTNYGDRPNWDATVVPISMLFSQSLLRSGRPEFADDLMSQAARGASAIDGDRVFELDPGRSIQLLSVLASTSELSYEAAFRSFAILNQSHKNGPASGTDYFIGGFYGQPLTPDDHWTAAVKILADHPQLAAQLLDTSPLPEPDRTTRVRPAFDLEFELSKRHDIIRPDVLWSQLLSGSREDATMSGQVIATYLLDSPNGDAESWERFSAEFGSGETHRRSGPVLDALALKWAERPLRSVHLGNNNQHGLLAADQFLTALFKSDNAFATVTYAAQITTRDMTVDMVQQQDVDPQQMSRLWEAYGIALNDSDRSNHQASLNLIEKAAKFAWSSGAAAIPGLKAASLTFGAFKEFSNWAIESGFDEIELGGSGTPTPAEAVLSFTRTDFHSSGPVDWTVASTLLADPDTQEKYPDAVRLLAGHLDTNNALQLPAPNASLVEESDYAEWFDNTFYGGVRDFTDADEVAGDLNEDGRLDAAEIQLKELGRDIQDSTTEARTRLFRSIRVAEAVG